MMFFPFLPTRLDLRCDRHWWQHLVAKLLVGLMLAIGCWTATGIPPALAVLTDDHYDGNIFPLYAGNGYLVPPKVPLKDSLSHHTPALLVFYIDDSSDCKQYAPVVSQVDAYYGRVADLIPISVDTLPVKSTYEPTEAGYYYTGVVPQTLVFNQAGEVVLNETGLTSFERIDDAFRDVFDLLPRSESVELKRRAVNEVSTELVQ